MKRLRYIIFLSLVAGTVWVNAQPFSEEIAAFKKQDSIVFPEKNQVLFIGSSSFTMWKDVKDYFPGIGILNRGFGGSSLTDLIRYEKDIIFPYHPRQVVIYCGENDIAASDTVSGEMVLQRFQQLFSDIRSRWPSVPLVFISLKPSPSRWYMKDRMIKASLLIKEFLATQKHTTFIDVWNAMLDAGGKPMEDIYLEDQLHMNAKGYAIWQKHLAPVLIK